MSSKRLSQSPGSIESSPRNWSIRQKWFTVVIVSVMSFACTMASSSISPARELLQADFHISRTTGVLTFSIFNLGLTMGTIISPTASEKFGRKIVFMIGMPVMLVFVVASGFCRNLASLLACRLVAGLFASPGITIASATMSDLFEPSRRGPAMFCYYSMPWLGSLVGPLISYLVLSVQNRWQWTQWVYILIAAPVVLAGLLFLKETSTTAKPANVTGQDRLPTIASLKDSISDVGGHVPYLITHSLLRPLHMLVTEPIVGLVCLYSGFNFGLIYAFIAVMPDMFRSQYGWDDDELGPCFLGLIAGGLLGWTTLLLDDQFVPKTKFTGSDEDLDLRVLAPENRLHGAMLGGILLPIGLFWFAWTARKDVSYISSMFASVLISWGGLSIYASTSSYVLDTYGPKHGASANGASSMVRYGASFAVPLFAFQLYDALGIGWATSLLGFASLAMMPISWSFYRWGPRIRARCRAATEVSSGISA